MLTRRFLIALAAALLLFVLPGSFSAALRDAASRITSPLTSFLMARSGGLRNAFNNFRDLGNLRADRESLQEQVITLQQQLIDQEALRAENEDLRKQIGVTGVVRDTPKVLAQVSLLNTIDPLDPTFTISVGSLSGVKVGQPAVYQGYLVGRVVEVREHSAVVRSIRSVRSQIQAAITFNRELGIVAGTGSGAALKFINQGVEIPENGAVETSGLGGTLPQGILIGSTGERLSADSDTSQTFSITQEAAPADIRSMFILLTDTV